MSRPEIDNDASEDMAWARIACDPRLASVIDSVRRVSGLAPEADEPRTFAPQRGAAVPERADTFGAEDGDDAGPAAREGLDQTPRPSNHPSPRDDGAVIAGERRPSPRSNTRAIDAGDAPAARRRPGRAAATADPVPVTRRPRTPSGRDGLIRSLVLAASVALLLHALVVFVFGGGAAILRAAVEDGLGSLELSLVSEELSGSAPAHAVTAATD